MLQKKLNKLSIIKSINHLQSMKLFSYHCSMEKRVKKGKKPAAAEGKSTVNAGDSARREPESEDGFDEFSDDEGSVLKARECGG